MKYAPEDIARDLAAAKGLLLRTVLLYGSAAAGDQVGARANLNLLVVLERLGRAELDALAEPARRWIRAGNPPPMLFTEARLTRSADVFPIEILDLKETGRILHGEDILAHVHVRPEHLRIEIEHELKGKLAHLQSEYLHTGGRARPLRTLMADSLSTFLVLARALLRFFEPKVPSNKFEALRVLHRHVPFDRAAFDAVREIKDGRSRPSGGELAGLFGRYLDAVEELVIAADTRLDPGSSLPTESRATEKERSTS